MALDKLEGNSMDGGECTTGLRRKIQVLVTASERSSPAGPQFIPLRLKDTGSGTCCGGGEVEGAGGSKSGYANLMQNWLARARTTTLSLR